MQTVGTVGAVGRRDDLRRVDGLGQGVDLLVHPDAQTLAIGLHHLAGKQGHLLGLQLQVAEQAVVHLLHLGGPFRVAGVRLALVHQDALDHAVFLGLLAQSDQPLIGIVAVGLEHALHPVGGLVLGIVGNLVGHEAFDLDAADGHGNHAHTDVGGQTGCQCAPEIIDGCQAIVAAAERRKGLVPFAHLPAATVVVDGGHHLEAVAYTLQVLGLRAGGSLHVRLAETEENVEVGVLCPTDVEHAEHEKR